MENISEVERYATFTNHVNIILPTYPNSSISCFKCEIVTYGNNKSGLLRMVKVSFLSIYFPWQQHHSDYSYGIRYYKYLTMLDKFHIALQCLFVQMANLSQSTFLFRGNKRDGQTINKNKLCQVQD